MAQAILGQVIAIKGAVVDVGFQPDHLPEIYDALEIERPNQGRLVLEVQQHLGEGRVRAIAMDTTDGLRRGVNVSQHGPADHGAGRPFHAWAHL